jgi:cell division transport system ATP-binding protein
MAHTHILLLADEPTGNLDDYSSELVWELLKAARTHLKATVLVVTHKIPATINTDYRHYFLDSGRLHEVS